MSIAADWQPVWKYAEHDFTDDGYTEDSMTFRVRVIDDEQDAGDYEAGTTIYTGVVSANADGNLPVSINDIVADYLSAPFQMLIGGRWYTQQLGAWFALDVYDTTQGAYVAGVADWYFTKDYSYDYDFDLGTMALGHPVTGVAAPNQWLVASAVDLDGLGEVDVTLTYTDGTTEILAAIYLGRYADFNEDFNNDFAISAADVAVAGYAALYLGNYEGLASVTFECSGITIAAYSVRQDTCKQYCLYYRNAYGGWDSLLLDSAVRKESYTRANIGRWVDNGSRGAASGEQYRNDVTEQWELKVGGLNDTQARLMTQVQGSVDVYLCDLVHDTLTPLLLTGGEATEQQFATNGHKRKEYTLTASTAAYRTRR